jgi:hypothetical protein
MRAEEERMDVPPAEAQEVGARVRERHPVAALSRHEDVAVAVVVEDPPHVAGQEVIEREIAAVLEAPDSLAGVVQVAGAPLGRSAVGVDLQGRGHRDHRNGIMMRCRPSAAPHQEQRSGDRSKVSFHGAEYGPPTRRQATR